MPAEFELGGRIVPWGRRAEEYERFFALDDAALNGTTGRRRILDCGAGPSSFAAEWAALGRFVVAIDPAYRFGSDALAAEFEDTAERMLRGMREGFARFRWDGYGSPEAVVERRREALGRFGDDVRSRSPDGRYVAAELPRLPFRAGAFDLVLCSHLLFLYSAELALEAHVEFLLELLRVGREVRVFPLLDMDGVRSRHLDACMERLAETAEVELVPVRFEFRVGDGSMMRLSSR